MCSQACSASCWGAKAKPTSNLFENSLRTSNLGGSTSGEGYKKTFCPHGITSNRTNCTKFRGYTSKHAYGPHGDTYVLYASVEVRYVLYLDIVRSVRPKKESLGPSRDRAVGKRTNTLLLQRLFQYRRSHDVLYLLAWQAKSCLAVAALSFTL